MSSEKITSKDFEGLVGEFLEEEEKLMEWKAQEYSTDGDRLQNFREVAFLEQRKMSQVAFSYLLKHLQSIALVVNNGRVKWCWEDENGNEGTKQRIADARNYLLLLSACIEEEEKI